jgi:CheY-like chemotaxis protein
MAVGASARVLVVDDGELVRETLAAELGELGDRGFDTLTATSGAEAVALVEAGEPLAALVSDLSMPGMNGVATIQKVRTLRPLLPCWTERLRRGESGPEPTLAPVSRRQAA